MQKTSQNEEISEDAQEEERTDEYDQDGSISFEDDVDRDTTRRKLHQEFSYENVKKFA